MTKEDEPSPDAVRVPVRQRIWTAILIGLASGIFCWLCSLRPGSVPDFYYPHHAAGLFLDGKNPYLVMSTANAATRNTALYYPFTAVLAAAPFARLPLGVAAAIFLGISAGAFAFCITRDGLWRIHVFASSPFVIAALLGQYTPLVTVMAYLPAAGFLAALKPNVGLALFLRRPTVQAVIGSAAVIGVSLVLFPTWPQFWLSALRADVAETRVHTMPVQQFGGVLLLLGLVAWRRTSGRLLVAMSLIPQLLFFYDALPLWLIPRTRKQSIFLTGCSQLSIVCWYFSLQGGEDVVRGAAPSVLWLIFMPALLVVLWQWRQGRTAASTQLRS